MGIGASKDHVGADKIVCNGRLHNVTHDFYNFAIDGDAFDVSGRDFDFWVSYI
jgi:hypothetical protein